MVRDIIPRKTGPPDHVFVAGVSTTEASSVSSGAAESWSQAGLLVLRVRAPAQTLTVPMTSSVLDSGFAHTWWTVPSSR
jgi:hypothetical protein